ncbi:MAG: O-acetyl-ADP-ribose deacetylase [Cyanobacteria bacterium SZAS LIN-3]|nr:O-acetyl-ADP-ribose deacetylase [Cyanobacteria bacterium SZAS LIN-3]
MAANCERQICGTLLSLSRGDITRQDVDVIVNAANSSLMGGGGVDGAIHRAGGPTILEECLQIRKMQGGCAPGSAVITSGGNLKAQYVIHTVGPIYRGGGNEATVLASAYRSSLILAVDYELKSIAFPSISTGAYGYPLQEAATVALSTVAQFVKEKQAEGREGVLTLVRFVLFDPATLDAYQRALDDID